MGYYGRRKRRRYRRDFGLEHAIEHISEAKALSRAVGGTDEDVKKYFFSLTWQDLQPVLSEYSRQHGRGAREYAERTIPKWRSGRTQMSGLVAARLFEILPKFMPLEQKYALVESIWSNFAPTSQFSISFGFNCHPIEVAERLAEHLAAHVNGHSVPESLQRRFQWLSAGDAATMQELLNHFLLRDRQQAVQVITSEVAAILEEAGSSDAVQGYKREAKIGGHRVYVFLDPRAKRVEVTPGLPRYRRPPDYSWVGGLIGMAAAVAAPIFIIFWCSGGC